MFSARGLEWRARAQKNTIVPTLRIEKAGWVWGGLKGEEVGLFILKLDGVSFRVRRKAKDDDEVVAPTINQSLVSLLNNDRWRCLT